MPCAFFASLTAREICYRSAGARRSCRDAARCKRFRILVADDESAQLVEDKPALIAVSRRGHHLPAGLLLRSEQVAEREGRDELAFAVLLSPRSARRAHHAAPLRLVAYHASMIPRCHGRSLKRRPACMPPRDLQPSMKRITRSARDKPLACQRGRRLRDGCSAPRPAPGGRLVLSGPSKLTAHEGGGRSSPLSSERFFDRASRLSRHPWPPPGSTGASGRVACRSRHSLAQARLASASVDG